MEAFYGRRNDHIIEGPSGTVLKMRWLDPSPFDMGDSIIEKDDTHVQEPMNTTEYIRAHHISKWYRDKLF